MIAGEVGYYDNLIGKLEEAIQWIVTLTEVADNDPEATQNWYIPALTMDYHGYDMDKFWDGQEQMRSNEAKNAYFQKYAEVIIDSLKRRIATNRFYAEHGE